MAAWDLDEAKKRLQQWMDADEAVALNQSYEIAGRRLTRADAETIQQRIQFWRKEVDRLENKRGRGPRVKRVIPRDG
ncbi:MAG: DUF6148 family protein [Thiohalorhabdus sp.]